MTESESAQNVPDPTDREPNPIHESGGIQIDREPSPVKAVTYLPHPGDPDETSIAGIKFVAGVPTMLDTRKPLEARVFNNCWHNAWFHVAEEGSAQAPPLAPKVAAAREQENAIDAAMENAASKKELAKALRAKADILDPPEAK